MKYSDKNEEISKLRKEAEALLLQVNPNSETLLSETNTLKLIHELQVHKVELELLNEQLIEARMTAQKAADKYTELYDFAPSGYFTLSRNGEIMELNLYGSQMLCKERYHLKNSQFGFFVADEMKPNFYLFLNDIFASTFKKTCELTLITSDDSSLNVLATGICSNSNEQCLITIVDISAQKQTERELFQAKIRAEESDKLKSAFLVNMSHEIRTPMNGILGFIELLKRPQLSGERVNRYVSMIEKGGLRMLNIINDLIDISKIEAGQINVKLSDCNFKEQIEYVHNFFSNEALNKGIQINFHNSLYGNDIIIQTDTEKLIAILSNLVKNAIKYTDSGTIDIGYRIIKANPIVDDAGNSDLIEFYIKDTGIGIPQDKLKLIFERFVQVDSSDTRAFQGAGLGLAISKAYVEMLGGQIWIKSEEGKGSTFYFTIPYILARKSKPDNNIVQDTSTKDNHFKKLNILIVEDDESSAMLEDEIVKEYSQHIYHVSTGLDAVEACQKYPDLDLILMDIQMPVMTGIEATKQIRKFNKDIIIIAQTAFVFSGDRERALAIGCNDYISKPIDHTYLIELIQQYFSN